MASFKKKKLKSFSLCRFLLPYAHLSLKKKTLRCFKMSKKLLIYCITELRWLKIELFFYQYNCNNECLYIEVEEVKRRQHCLMFSSAGSQAQTYFVNFDTLTDYQRWHRQASKVSKTQRVCFTVCSSHNMYVFSLQQFVCFQLVPLVLYLNQRLDVGTTVAFCLLIRPIWNPPSESVWLAPQRQALSDVWLWLNSIPLFTYCSLSCLLILEGIRVLRSSAVECLSFKQL